MQLFRFYMVRLLKVASANNVRVKMIGDRTRFDQDIIDGINRLESETKDNTGLTFVIAVNYGGRDEITRAMKKTGCGLCGRKAGSGGDYRAGCGLLS